MRHPSGPVECRATDRAKNSDTHQPREHRGVPRRQSPDSPDEPIEHGNAHYGVGECRGTRGLEKLSRLVADWIGEDRRSRQRGKVRLLARNPKDRSSVR
jgi:hypothetical protein